MEPEAANEGRHSAQRFAHDWWREIYRRPVLRGVAGGCDEDELGDCAMTREEYYERFAPGSRD